MHDALPTARGTPSQLRRSHETSQVVCRMVGMTGGRAIKGDFGRPTQPAVLDGLDCAGWEGNLTAW